MEEKIGLRIKKLRKFIKVTREEFSDNISPSTLRHWENGNYEPKESNIEEIIKSFRIYGLHISPTWLKDGMGTPPTKNGETINEFSLNSEHSIDSFEEILIQNDGLVYNDIEKIKEYYNEKQIDFLELMINDQKMYPKYRIGDYVFGIKINHNKYNSIDMEPVILRMLCGSICFCYMSFLKRRNIISFMYEKFPADFKVSDIKDTFFMTIHRKMLP